MENKCSFSIIQARNRSLHSFVVLSLATVLLLPLFLSSSGKLFVQCVDILQRQIDHYNSNANTLETVLNTSNVNVNDFGKISSRNVDGYVYAQILYKENVSIPLLGNRNVIFIATSANTVYAYDADATDPNIAPIWSRNFGPPIARCGDDPTRLGINSTPLIVNGTIYFVTTSSISPTAQHRLHALDITTGVEVLPAVVIQARYQLPGRPVITFNGAVHRQRLV